MIGWYGPVQSVKIIGIAIWWAHVSLWDELGKGNTGYSYHTITINWD